MSFSEATGDKIRIKDRDMKKIFKTLILAAVAVMAMGLTGCVKETAVSGIAPDMTPKENVQFDFVQLHNDTLEAFGDESENPYRYITDLYISGDNDTKTIDIKATCFPGTGLPEAEQFATAVIRRVNDCAHIQSSYYALSNQESFGGLWSKFTLNLQIIPEGSEDDPSKYLINVSIAPGEEIPFDTDYETYEEGYMDILDSMANQPVVLNQKGSENDENDTEASETPEAE